MDERFLRSECLIGKAELCKLNSSAVAVFGIGGVGSYALEALVRSGVGTVYIYDNDTVSKSNINRQLIALESTVGQSKVDIAKRRCLDINPNLTVFEFCEFIGNDSTIPFDKFDYIIDAVDNVTAKLFLIENAKRSGIPIISVMGTGNKLDLTRLKIDDINKTSQCPLCKVMRHELKKRSIENVTVIWSDEIPKKSGCTTEEKANGRPSPASMVFVPAAAGLLAAEHVIENLIK